MTEKAIATTEPVGMPESGEAPATREERRYQAPPVDIYEVEEGLCVTADLPGVDPQGVEIKVDNSILTIVGHVSAPAGTDTTYQEFALSDYFRQFRLHDAVDQEKIAAQIRQGVLRIVLPHREETKPRQIEVQVG